MPKNSFSLVAQLSIGRSATNLALVKELLDTCRILCLLFKVFLILVAQLPASWRRIPHSGRSATTGRSATSLLEKEFIFAPLLIMQA
ncbi:hypothetical protein QL285_010948 [Trifolium repens]|nr:hypothetical protein QL285_010948 [Trifolium repens]